MTLGELIEAFRTEADDATQKPLWTDSFVVRLFAEAEEEAAIRKKLLFDDSTATISPLAVVAGANAFLIDERFFLVTNITLWNAANTKYIGPMRPVSRDKLDQMFSDWRNDRGTPYWYIQEDKRLVLPGNADRTYSLHVEGYRTPLVPLSLNTGMDTAPEIGRIHHRFLVHWALHRAYGIQDADTFDATRRDNELKAFEQYFGRRPDADLYKDAQADQPHANVGYY